MKSRSKIEDAIQRDLIHWIKQNYPTVKVFATRNEDSYKRSNEIEAGLPDLILRWQVGDIRHFLYFEIKTMTGRLSKKQREWAEEPRCANEHYLAGYGLKECRELIANFFQNQPA